MNHWYVYTQGSFNGNFWAERASLQFHYGFTMQNQSIAMQMKNAIFRMLFRRRVLSFPHLDYYKPLYLIKGRFQHKVIGQCCWQSWTYSTQSCAMHVHDVIRVGCTTLQYINRVLFYLLVRFQSHECIFFVEINYNIHLYIYKWRSFSRFYKSYPA